MSAPKTVVIDPRQVGLLLENNHVYTEAECNAAFKHVKVGPPFTDEAAFAKLKQFIIDGIEEAGKNDGWLAAVPTTLVMKLEALCAEHPTTHQEEKDAIVAEIVQYIGMVVAIDFRHWCDADDVTDDVRKAAVLTETARETGFGINVVHFFKKIDYDGIVAHTESKTLVRGSAAMVHMCKKAVEEGVEWHKGNCIDAEKSSEAQLSALFSGCGKDGETPMTMPAVKRRIELIKSVAQAVDFPAVLKASNKRLFNNGLGFIEQLVALHPRYDDSAVFTSATDSAKSFKVYFLKLAQLTVVAMHSALTGLSAKLPHCSEVNAYLELLTFDDNDDMSVCSDYQLPRGLRAASYLRYDDHLSSLVDNLQHITPNSREEIEVRLASTVASKYLQDAINAELSTQNGTENKKLCDVATMDYALWKYGRSMGVDHPQPHHLTKTDKY